MFLDPPWVHVTWPRRLHWRIYFSVKTGLGTSQAVSQYLDPDQADVLKQLPAIRKFVAQVEAAGDDRDIPAPRLSLHEIYAGKVPETFDEVDAHKTIATVFCDNIARSKPAIQQAFYAKPNKKPSPLHAGMIGMFTGTLHPNRPELSYHQKEEKKLHHFNLKLTAIRPIRVQLDEATARRRYKEEINKATMRLQDACKRQSLTFQFDPDQRPRISWIDQRMVVSGVITPRPRFSRKPVPYATASVFFNPQTGKPVQIVVVQRTHRDPPD